MQLAELRFKYQAKGSNGVYTYTIDPADVQIKPRGASVYKPLDRNKKYRVGSTDFIWKKGYTDGYEIFSKGAGKTSQPRLNSGAVISFRKTVEDAIAKLPNKTVTSQIEGRITRQEQ